MPLVDADDKEIDITKPWCLQTASQQERTLELLDAYREDLISEDFPQGFEVRKLDSGRVLVIPADEEPLVAYLHDPQDPNAFLVLDDFTPEIWEEWWDPKPQVQPVKPTPLSQL